jgi:hypothetical protein
VRNEQLPPYAARLGRRQERPVNELAACRLINYRALLTCCGGVSALTRQPRALHVDERTVETRIDALVKAEQE